MGLFFVLNSRKSLDSYKKDDKIGVVIRYYHDKKRTNFPTGVKVCIDSWNQNYKKTKQKGPVRKSDSDSDTKNLLLLNKLNELEQLINTIQIKNDTIPTVDMVKSYHQNHQFKKISKTLSHIHFLILFEEYTKWFQSEEYLIVTKNSKSYQTALKTSFEDVTDFIREYQLSENVRLLLEHIDLEWTSKLIMYLEKKGYLPSTINKRIKVLRLFRTWLEDEKKTTFTLNIPKKRFIEHQKEVIRFTHKEILQLHNFDKFDASNQNHGKYLKKKSSDVVYIDEVLHNNKTITYTNYEVYKDMLVWLCVTGMRFSDCINLKVVCKEFISSENRKLGEIKYTSQKTGNLIYVPIVNITEDLFEKYSKNKKASDSLFPLTSKGNLISNQKINKHVKDICRIVGMNRSVTNPIYGSNNKPIEGTDKPKPLYEEVSTHIGRRSFIGYHIQKGTPVHTIKSMSGHRSTKVFEKYFSIQKDDRLKSMDFGFTLGEPFSTIKREKTKKQSVGLTDSRRELLQELKTSLDSGWIPQEVWEEEVKKVMNS
tara:strand:+ start:143 stop:1756 length:1614 start_codon:yes stop_codon:yes gene_type:complete